MPFLLKAGKALHTKRAEIRVQFRHVPGNLYKNKLGIDLDQATNELVSCCCLQASHICSNPCIQRRQWWGLRDAIARLVYQQHSCDLSTNADAYFVKA